MSIYIYIHIYIYVYIVNTINPDDFFQPTKFQVGFSNEFTRVISTINHRIQLLTSQLNAILGGSIL